MKRTAFAALSLLIAPILLARQAPPPGAERAPAPIPQPDFTNPHKPFSLMVGDPAPSLKINNWILGEPIDALEPGKVYLIFLWSILDEQCASLMPCLTELQNQYAPKGLVVVGASSPGRINTQEAVEKFVFENRVGFHIAWDKSRVVMDQWLTPAGRTSMPCLFIVDQESRVAFIGGIAEFEAPLKEVLDQNFDIDTQARQYAECITASWAYTHYEEKISNREWPAATNLGREIVNGRGNNCYAVLHNIAWINVDPNKPIDNPDLELALTAARRADELTSGKDSDTIDTLARVYFLKGDFEKAVEIQQRAVDMARSDKLRQPLAKTLAEYRGKLAKP